MWSSGFTARLEGSMEAATATAWWRLDSRDGNLKRRSLGVATNITHGCSPVPTQENNVDWRLWILQRLNRSCLQFGQKKDDSYKSSWRWLLMRVTSSSSWLKALFVYLPCRLSFLLNITSYLWFTVTAAQLVTVCTRMHRNAQQSLDKLFVRI